MIANIHRAWYSVPEHLRPLLIQCAVIYTSLVVAAVGIVLVKAAELVGISATLTHNAMFGCTLATCLTPGAVRYLWGRREW